MMTSSRPQLLGRLGSRTVALALALAQVAFGVPLHAQATARLAGPAKVKAAPLPAPKVTVNRKVPRVEPPASAPAFSAQPTDAEIFRAHAFPEPLVPIGATSPQENTALADAIMAYVKAQRPDDIAPFTGFLSAHGSSPWRAALLLNMGTVQRRLGFLTRAQASWDEAWRLSKDGAAPHTRALADATLSEWLDLATTLGQVTILRDVLGKVQTREVHGRAAGRVSQARAVLAQIEQHPEHVRSSGVASLQALLEQQGAISAHARAALDGYRPTSAGMTLSRLTALAREVGIAVRPGRALNADPVVPSIVHLKIGHFSPVLQAKDGRYLVRDPIFGGEAWLSREALREECSGFALLTEGALANEWAAVTPAAAEAVVGRSCPSGSAGPGAPPPDECNGGGAAAGGGGSAGGGCPGCAGMAAYRFHPVQASLLLDDNPLIYSPAVGPAVALRLHYNHRYAVQPQLPTYSNLGPNWMLDWVVYVEETGAGGDWPAHVRALIPGGGEEDYFTADANGVFPIYAQTGSQLTRVSSSPIRYERRRSDDTVEVYAQSDGGLPGQRRIFLTEIRDPQGQSLQFTWDVQLRLVAVTDAVGQVTTLSYAHPTDALKVTSVTDPFGRVATLTYNTAGQLQSITDVVGLTSSFSYAESDFIAALKTPYGTTTFRHETVQDVDEQMIEATDPLGATEHLEWHYAPSGVSATAPANEVPAGFESSNADLNRSVTYHWNKRAWAAGPGDVSKATMTRWMWYAPEGLGTFWAVPVPHSIKRPLEGRVWYRYPDQSGASILTALGEPSAIGRVLDDGTSQVSSATYNAHGRVASRTDAAGRQTLYSYVTNGLDLYEVRQVNGGSTDLLARYESYTSTRQPQTVTDAAGQVTHFTYNAAGRILTATNAKQETTTYVYNTSGQLESVTGPVAGSTTSYTYDAYGRLRTTTGPDGYATTSDYDTFDRPIRVTYPDATYDETTYDRLDVGTRRDRAGRVTRYFHDALRRVVATRDPAGRTIGQTFSTGGGGCASCAGVDTLTDAKGQTTTWERDVEGRVTREIRADATTITTYGYETTTSRLKTVTDPKAQVTTYTYNPDDTIASIDFTNAQIATPSVSYTYETAYNRVATMVDGTGTTTYTYKAAGALGAGQVASVDGPLTDDAITYAYDELGRVTGRAINGVAATQIYDSLGRVTSETNVLGTFDYTYVGATGRLETVTYPNGQTSGYAYFDNEGDQRLQTIHHRKPDASTLSKFDYTYDAVGNIVTWRQQADQTAVVWEYGYDAADQLTGAVKKATDEPGTVLKRYGYAYDLAGNRTAEQIDDSVTLATHDNLNRLLAHQPGGMLTFKGTVDEPATVTVAGRPATVSAGNAWQAAVPLTAGTNQVTITATDASGNTATATYEVDIAGTTKTFAYDANGNMTGDGTRTFEWDARNQLVAVTLGAHRSEFTYDALYRRVRMCERENGVVVLDAAILWDGLEIAEERTVAGTTNRFFANGEQHGSEPRYLTRDHLSSVRELTDGVATLLTRYEHDPYGRATRLLGTEDGQFGYSSHLVHSISGLTLAQRRAYDPEVGRWLSEDPSGFGDGPNIYAYVGSNPLARLDRYGLQFDSVTRTMQEAIRRGNVAEIRNILQVAENGLSAEWKKAAQEAIKQLQTPARDLIRATLKRSQSYASELEEDTLEQLIKAGSKKAKDMIKLIKQSDRLMEKVNQCIR